MRVNHESLLTLKMIASKRERLNRVYKGPDFPEGYFRRSPCNCGVSSVLSIIVPAAFFTQTFIYVGVLV